MESKTGLPENEYRITLQDGTVHVVVAPSLEDACRALGVRVEDVYGEEYLDNDLMG